MSATFIHVQRLIEPYLGEGYHVYMDRYYTGLRIFRFLQLHDTGACGTIMQNRIGLDNNQSVAIQKLIKNQALFYQYDKKMLLSLWMDKKPICMLSTIHNCDIVQNERWEKKPETKAHSQKNPKSEKEKLDRPV